jgi:hypothetical protein
MDKKVIIEKLDSNHKHFANYIASLDGKSFCTALNNEKWTPGQQIDHICLSLAPLNKIMAPPKFILKFILKKANRQSRTYDELVKRYHERLARGGKAFGPFVPPFVDATEQTQLCTNVQKLALKLSQLLNRWNENEIDRFVLPHPLLGRVTIREMMYFTIYHVEHHESLTKRDLAATKVVA